MIESEEAVETARQINAKEGIFVGMSSGAELAALRTADKIDSGTSWSHFPTRRGNI